CDVCVPEERQHAIAATRAARRPVPVRTDDGRPDALRILMGLAALPFPMGRRKVARVLTGASSSPIDADRCAEFGALQHCTIKDLEAVIEQLVEEGYIGRAAVGEFPVLALTARGRQAIQDPSLLPAWSTQAPA